MVFAPEKYELMHFSQWHTPNMGATLMIGDREIQPAAVMRVLSVFLNPWLH